MLRGPRSLDCSPSREGNYLPLKPSIFKLDGWASGASPERELGQCYNEVLGEELGHSATQLCCERAGSQWIYTVVRLNSWVTVLQQCAGGRDQGHSATKVRCERPGSQCHNEGIAKNMVVARGRGLSTHLNFLVSTEHI